MTPRVREILNWYGADNPGVLTNLARIMNHGKLAGTGKMVILPVDQGFEHGPARSFAKNPDGYDPNYHVELAIESGCNAYAAPLGFIEAIARDYAGEIPLILKINNSESLWGSKAPISAVTSYIDDALRLGCVGIGFTVYPGSAERKQMYEEIAEAARLAKQAGLVVIIWSYPRGEQLSKEGEQAIDVIAYAAHIAAQLGAHIIKVKPPTAHIEQAAAAKVYAEQGIKVSTMTDRIRHVVQSCFNGKRIVIFSGGEAKGTEELLKEVQEMGQGGGFGSIMGRNAFQRPKKESIALLHGVMEAFAGKKL
ncbi:class I fructose-bisphosphate aldolase [Bdellovibrio sp. SKB1291214]|uniref:class I fructose-bisphosphate aldolase n=1 Tax=Bdellovibrio sp. SKB1291214 TaxID=1732569 RepID=UPI00223EC105|nr:class I fructose-bisphosphate aldolase [Bdellovibrio sp. SKB1291214]UYL07714.1 class I fructose-bisphosphate aldolase [Bdellovibrio sp. SKB1291214]